MTTSPPAAPALAIVTASGSLQGMIWVYDEDGVTPFASGSINVNQGTAYKLVLGGS
jgi:hypothetical protein